MFESEYAKTDYIKKDNAVFHVWKKEAHFSDYRTPVIASLEMLRAHAGSLFIVDARNGFEDTPEDVEWGFQYFLPELKRPDAEYGALFCRSYPKSKEKLTCGRRKLRKTSL